MYRLPAPKEAASWKSWGGVQTAAAVAEETARIQTELDRMAGQAEFGLEILPLAKVDSLLIRLLFNSDKQPDKQASFCIHPYSVCCGFLSRWKTQKHPLLSAILSATFSLRSWRGGP